MRRTEAEIRQQLNEAEANVLLGRTEFRGNTYEDGVTAALGWVLGDDDTAPMDEEN